MIHLHVFAYATPPLAPSSPKRILILAVGSVLRTFHWKRTQPS